MPDLLLELFSEEIPARMQRKAAEDLQKRVTNALVDRGLTYEGVRNYHTPRRLCLDIRGLTKRSADIREERKGPKIDAPQKAIEGFMRGAGLTNIKDATVQSDPKKGEHYVAVIEKPGQPAREIIADALPEIIKNFPWPKSMRWGYKSAQPGSLSWVRPLQSILCTLATENDDWEVIDFEIESVKAQNFTIGHRFMAPDKIEVKRFDDYQQSLNAAKVMIDADQRKEIILADAKNLAFAQGFELVEDNKLLEEVAGLVEWPVVLMSEFDPAFLDIPRKIIQLTIRENQKCFVLNKPDANSPDEYELTHNFILVSNMIASDDGVEICRGNAKVVNARLSDAKFFWDSDLAQINSEAGFSPWIEKLDKMTFHAKLGSLGERVARIGGLANALASKIGADEKQSHRAALLCKADLNCAVVYEFPEMQGFVGNIYAQRAGEDKAVAQAIEDHYKPLGPTDDVPTDPVSVTIALAEKIDTLVGFWAIDEKPTGSKDPFALRRAALGIIRLLLENQISLQLETLLAPHFKLMGTNPVELTLDLLAFFHDRLKVYLREKGIRHDLIDAVILVDSDNMLALSRHAEALQKLIVSNDGENLLAGYKRVANILAAEEKKGAELDGEIDETLFISNEEILLNQSLNKIEKEVSKVLDEDDIISAVETMALMRQPVDAFFENVLVNDDNPKIRANRLALLRRIRMVTSQVADFSKISG